jgi:hypothetical protein
MEGLRLHAGSKKIENKEQNALVPYKGDGKLVPYDGFEVVKKHKPRPKVDLDPESDRVWKLLMGKEGSQGLEGTDKGKEQWWGEERKVFHGRVDSFIARMHLVQGTISYTFAPTYSRLLLSSTVERERERERTIHTVSAFNLMKSRYAMLLPLTKLS